MIKNSGQIAIRKLGIAHSITKKLSLSGLIKKQNDIWDNVRNYDTTMTPSVVLRDYKIRFQEEKNDIWITLWF